MKTIKVTALFIIFFFALQSSTTEPEANTNKKLVYVFEMREDIMPPAWRLTKQCFEEAETLGADYIVILLDTYGGMVNIADSIRTRILYSHIPVLVFIYNNAASAGALISIAADSIYMKKGATIGAVTGVNQTGEVAPEKIQSYLRSKMRATAEYHGKDTIISGNDTIIDWHRDPSIAEAMVDETVVVPGLIDSSKVLTFTAEEALQHGFCEGITNSIREVLQNAGIEDYEIVEYEITPVQSIVDFFLRPAISGILIMIIIGGIYFELQTPGVGFPLAAAIIAAILYFVPLYLENLAANWEIVLFILGIILLGVEIFAIPGFGVTGILGIICVILGLTLSMMGEVEVEMGRIPDFSQAMKPLLIVTLSMFTSLMLSIFITKKLLSPRSLFPNLALNTVQETSEGFIGVDNRLAELVGKTGIAKTILRPSGKIEIEDDQYDAKSEYGFIEKGTEIKVIRFETGQLYVVKV